LNPTIPYFYIDNSKPTPMPRKEGSILIIDDNHDLLIALKLILARRFGRIDTLQNPNLILSTLEKQTYDLILLDMNFKPGQVTGNEGIFWMNKIREKDPHASVVFITAFGDVELAIRSLKEGAVDFIMKSWDEQKILSTLIAAYELRKSRMEVSLLKKKQAHLARELEKGLNMCHCQSLAMKEIDQMVAKIAGTDASVLILGENGTGKEVVAREIHRLSVRRDEIFMKTDLGALPESLFESELFGHTKGAFTDAREERDGRFVIASGGTLFLDEIGNLPPGLQSKLLSVLQNNEVANMDMGFWGSKVLNIYYQYPFQLGNSGFSINPGIGVGTEKYDFKDPYTLGYVDAANDTLAVIGLSDLFPNASGFKKSKISANYFAFSKNA